MARVLNITKDSFWNKLGVCKLTDKLVRSEIENAIRVNSSDVLDRANLADEERQKCEEHLFDCLELKYDCFAPIIRTRILHPRELENNDERQIFDIMTHLNPLLLVIEGHVEIHEHEPTSNAEHTITHPPTLPCEIIFEGDSFGEFEIDFSVLRSRQDYAYGATAGFRTAHPWIDVQSKNFWLRCTGKESLSQQDTYYRTSGRTNTQFLSGYSLLKKAAHHLQFVSPTKIVIVPWWIVHCIKKSCPLFSDNMLEVFSARHGRKNEIQCIANKLSGTEDSVDLIGSFDQNILPKCLDGTLPTLVPIVFYSQFRPLMALLNLAVATSPTIARTCSLPLKDDRKITNKGFCGPYMLYVPDPRLDEHQLAKFNPLILDSSVLPSRVLSLEMARKYSNNGIKFDRTSAYFGTDRKSIQPRLEGLRDAVQLETACAKNILNSMGLGKLTFEEHGPRRLCTDIFVIKSN